MAQISKANGDFLPVAVMDAQGYINTVVVFGASTLTATTLSITQLQGTFVPGQVVSGPGIDAGTIVVSYVGTTLTISKPTLGPALSNVPLSARTPYQLGATVQPQGPKLQYFTVTAPAAVPPAASLAAYIQQVVQAIGQLSTIHIYEVVDADTITMATYGTDCWTLAGLKTEIDLATGLVTTVTAGASFSTF